METFVISILEVAAEQTVTRFLRGEATQWQMLAARRFQKAAKAQGPS